MSDQRPRGNDRFERLSQALGTSVTAAPRRPHGRISVPRRWLAFAIVGSLAILLVALILAQLEAGRVERWTGAAAPIVTSGQTLAGCPPARAPEDGAPGWLRVDDALRVPTGDRVFVEVGERDGTLVDTGLRSGRLRLLAIGPGAQRSPREWVVVREGAVEGLAYGPPADCASVDPVSVLEAIDAQVLDVRRLTPPTLGPTTILTRDAMRAELANRFEAADVIAAQARETLVLHALGLLPIEADARGVELEMLGDRVLGFYDDRTDRMVIVADEPGSPLVRTTYAHEYTHALQDRTFDLSSLDLGVDFATLRDDATMARLALVEGDASWTTYAWAPRYLTDEELRGLGDDPRPGVAGFPPFLVAAGRAPYQDGRTFVEALVDRGGLQALDAAYRDPPTTTEQVLHPEKYLAHEPSVAITPASADPGPGGATTTLSMGEANIRAFLAATGLGPAEAAAAAAGWGGDELTVSTSVTTGDVAAAWRFIMDTPSERDELLAALRRSGEAMTALTVQVTPEGDRGLTMTALPRPAPD